MNKHLSNYVRVQRDRKGIRLGALAETLGYTGRRKNRGCRMILNFEREGIVSEDLLVKLIQALDLNMDEVQEAIDRDRAEWDAWADEPVPMRMIMKMIPAVYCPYPIPEDIVTPEQAQAYAMQVAKEKQKQICLVLNRRESLWIKSDGKIMGKTYAKPGIPNMPYSTIGGSRKFLFDCTRGGLKTKVLRESEDY